MTPSPYHNPQVRYKRRPSIVKMMSGKWCLKDLGGGRWAVQLWIPGKGIQYIGSRHSYSEAIKLRDDKRRQLFGDC